MSAWVDYETFRSFVGNTNPADIAALQAALELGCEKVDELCGPTIAAEVTTAPAWAVSAACLIGNQWFKSRLRPTQSDPTTMTGFLVPNQAMEIMAGHLLAPDGFA